jgi:hypothetical protein
MREPTETKRAVVLPEVEIEGEDAVASSISLRSVIQEIVGETSGKGRKGR